jgi:hypothetical protein
MRAAAATPPRVEIFTMVVSSILLSMRFKQRSKNVVPAFALRNSRIDVCGAAAQLLWITIEPTGG